MAVFNITTGVCKSPGRPYFFNFECDCETVEELSARLSEGKIVAGSKLDVTDDGRGGLLIRGREPLGLGAPQAGLVQIPTRRLWELED